ncbi:hypothetical protein L6Q96_09130 [Candidatus Binatia bacterium]|nr:hypothetical protein [Candidatus Binatia bacterium]
MERTTAWRRAARWPGLTMALTLAIATAAGCGGDGNGSKTDPTPTRPPAPTATASPLPSATETSPPVSSPTPTPTLVPVGGVVSFSFAHVVGLTGPVVIGPDTPYTNAAGNRYGVMRLQYFVSDFVLEREGMDPVRLDDIHYVDLAEPATLQYTPSTPIPPGSYTGVSFVFGIPRAKNVSNAFVRPPESLMEWPDMMGGGYHYMKLEGRFVDRQQQIANYKLHTGMLMGMDYSVPVALPDLAIDVDDDEVEVEIAMDIAEWLQDPNVYDFNDYMPGMMGNAPAQRTAQQNGWNVFALGYVGPPEQRPPAVVPEPYVIELPANVPIPMIVPADNPTTVEGVALGRRLYYDSRLDGIGNRACATCHLQQTAFTSNRTTGILAHINLAFADAFLWDGKVQGTLEEVMRFEVEEFFEADMSRVAADPVYLDMFTRAFGPGPITTRKAAYALAQFQRTLVSFDSKLDRYLRGEESLTDAERRGAMLFYSETGDCFHCHGTTLFTDNRFHNTGLDTEPPRKGLADITGDAADNGKFKTPTLRNIALTAPYMHDDRYATLAEVIDFYSEGLQYSATVDPLMKNVAQGGVRLTTEEKADLLAFLLTLTDLSFTTNPALASPFE